MMKSCRLHFCFLALICLLFISAYYKQPTSENASVATLPSSIFASSAPEKFIPAPSNINLNQVSIQVLNDSPNAEMTFRVKAHIALLNALIEQNLPPLQKHALCLYRKIQILKLELIKIFVNPTMTEFAPNGQARTRKQIYQDLRACRKQLHQLKKIIKPNSCEFETEKLAQMYEMTPSLAQLLPQIGIGKSPHYFFNFLRENSNPFRHINFTKVIRFAISCTFNFFMIYWITKPQVIHVYHESFLPSPYRYIPEEVNFSINLPSLPSRNVYSTMKTWI